MASLGRQCLDAVERSPAHGQAGERRRRCFEGDATAFGQASMRWPVAGSRTTTTRSGLLVVGDAQWRPDHKRHVDPATVVASMRVSAGSAARTLGPHARHWTVSSRVTETVTGAPLAEQPASPR